MKIISEIFGRKARRKGSAMGGDRHVISEGVEIASGSQFHCDISIGRFARINGPLLAKGKGAVRIGEFAALGDNIRIITSNHLYNTPNIQEALQRKMGFRSVLGPARDVEIGPGSWIGDSAIFLPGSSIGAGGIVGAGAVVTKRFPAFSIVVGNPAKLIRLRFDESICNALLDIRWWDWEEDRISRNKRFFETDLSIIKDAEELGQLIVA